MFLLSANNFVFDLSFNRSYASVSVNEKEDKKIYQYLGGMYGFLLNMGYSFNLGSSKRFWEWDFLSIAGGVNKAYIVDESFWRDMHAVPTNKLTHKNNAIGIDVTILQSKIGGYIADNVAVYGIFSPVTFLAANVEGQCSNIPNFGLTIGAGVRFYFHKHWGVQAEWSCVQSWYAGEWRKNPPKLSDFASKLAMNRFSIGICART